MNIVGPNVARLRRKAGLTQTELAARCAEFGWPVSRPVIAKTEIQLRAVSDKELVALSRALCSPVDTLLRKRRN